MSKREWIILADGIEAIIGLLCKILLVISCLKYIFN
jgi:hypothetical protein